MITFRNSGLIDPRCVSTIGVSVKESENPIGFFGTGLKYAIAIVLRNGGTISVWRGLDELRFGYNAVQIRGESFDVVTMNDVELGFTTQLGKHWETWQAFREIWCNAKDEGGEIVPGAIDPAEGFTTVHVELAEMDECYRQRANYFLESVPIYDGKIVAFHPGPSRGIHFRGVFVGKIIDRPHLFAVNVLDPVELTEDRTIKNTWSVAQSLARGILQCEDEKFLERILTAPDEYAEHHIDLDWPFDPSPEFMTVTRRLILDTSRQLNRTAIKVLTRNEPAPDIEPTELFESEKEALAEAVLFCRALLFTVDEFPIVVAESLGNGILGRADRSKRQILLARRALQMGDLTTASTLIEEWAHIKHNLNDETREMQNWLFDSLVTMGAAYLRAKEPA